MDVQGLEQHRRILGILFIVLNVLTLLAALGLALFFGAVGVAALSSGTSEGAEGAAVSFFMLVLGGCFLAMGVPGLITGIGLLKRRPWSRPAALVLGILSLTNFPVGTALGIYAIWFFGQPESKRVFE